MRFCQPASGGTVIHARRSSTIDLSETNRIAHSRAAKSRSPTMSHIKEGGGLCDGFGEGMGRRFGPGRTRKGRDRGGEGGRRTCGSSGVEEAEGARDEDRERGQISVVRAVSSARVNRVEGGGALRVIGEGFAGGEVLSESEGGTGTSSRQEHGWGVRGRWRLGVGEQEARLRRRGRPKCSSLFVSRVSPIPVDLTPCPFS